MAETPDKELFINRAMLIAVDSEMDFYHKREAYRVLVESILARGKIDGMDAGLDSLNEEQFKKLSGVDGQ